MKYLKKTVMFFLACFLLIALLPPKSTCAGCGTREDALKWVYEQEGKNLDFDGVYGAQCVDLIDYYYQYLGVEIVWGNAYEFASNALPAGWQRIKNTASFVPEPGDIAVWGTSVGGGYGHVAIILEASTTSFTSMDQNWPKGACCSKVTHNYNGFWGVIRPNFDESTDNGTSGQVQEIQGLVLPISCHTLSGRVDTYTTNSLSTYSGYIDSGDLCKITKVYNNGTCEVVYPTSKGNKTAYTRTGNFFYELKFSTRTMSVGNQTCYIRSDSDLKLGMVYASDQAMIIGNNGSRTQIVYPVPGGYKMGWISGVYSIPEGTDNTAKICPPVYSVLDRGGVRGDVNGDGKVTITDAIMLSRIVKNNSALSDDEKYRADIDGDEKITENDSKLLNKVLVRLIPDCSEEEIVLRDGWYVIKSAADGNYVLDVEGASKENRANVILYENHYDLNQVYLIKRQGNGYYTITAVHSGKVLDVEKSETNVLQYSLDGSGSDNQLWKIYRAMDGSFRFKNKCNGKYLDVSGGIIADKTNIQVWESNFTTSQKFELEEYKMDGKTYAEREGTAGSEPSIQYSVHIENIGWQNSVSNGARAGTEGEYLKTEAIQISIVGMSGSVYYRTHLADIGWTSWKKDGAISGTTGENRKMEAVEVYLSGEIASKYSVYYRVHLEELGWLGWEKDGATAGSTGCNMQIEAVQIMLRPKDDGMATSQASVTRPVLTVEAHVGDIGWKTPVKEGENAGTTGRSLKLEAIKINCADFFGENGIQYRVHVSETGWQDWRVSGQVAGTVGENRQIEAIEVKLDGYLARIFDVYYRAHVQDYGWLGWACNGEKAGTEGGNMKMEAVQIILVRKGYSIDRGGAAFYDLVQKPDSTVTAKLEMLMGQYLGTTWNGYYYGSECKGFATFMFYKLFHVVHIGPYNTTYIYYLTNVSGATEVGRLSSGQMTVDAAKTLLQKGMPGDFIQVKRRNKTKGHSMILVSQDETGITVFDCNSDDKNSVKGYHITWQEFYNSNSAMSLYHAIDYQ